MTSSDARRDMDIRRFHRDSQRLLHAGVPHLTDAGAASIVEASRAADAARASEDRHMFEIVEEDLPVGPAPVTLETGEIARQAGGAVVVSMEDTVVLATVVARRTAKPGQSFFPLTVDYFEKFYAAGRIPGGFFKREGRPTEKETLTGSPDRPADPPAVPRGLHERSPGRADGAVEQSRDRSRHPGA